MALTGHLSDLSLSELIEFFCNQRKSGQLKVLYPSGPGYFYLQSGSVVDAKIGQLHGIDAVYYALTLPNAEFEFSADTLSVHRTINQPWTQVVLEGLRRLDEGISPGVAFPPGYVSDEDKAAAAAAAEEADSVPVQTELHRSFPPNLFSLGDSVSRRKPLFVSAVAVAVVASVAAIGVPAGWYHARKAGTPTEATRSTPAPQSNPVVEAPAATQPAPDVTGRQDDAAAIAAKRQKEKKAREARALEGSPIASTPAPAESKGGAKRMVVTVTYDESGRVTQASGGDATALRIARQKRFPPGKAGSATVTIPIN